MNQPILRHIRKIEYCAAYHLKRAIILPAQAIALVREPMPWQEIPIVRFAKLESIEDVENGVRIYTSKLTATLCKPFLHPKRPSAFRLTDVQGQTYLLGTSEKPHPLSVITIQYPEKVKDLIQYGLFTQWMSYTGYPLISEAY